MVRLSSYPVQAAPVAPARESTPRLLLRAWCVFILFGSLAHSFWFNLLGPWGAAALLVGSTIATVTSWRMMIRSGSVAPAQWRRLPWATVAYILVALASLAWSSWPMATALTWLLLACMSINGLFVAATLSWREIVRTLELAAKWVIGISVVMEVWVAWRGYPLGPNFLPRPENADAHWYWMRGHLFSDWLFGERIQGLVGNANLMAYVTAVALIVFAIQLVTKPRGRGFLVAWIVVSAYLFIRAGSVAAFAALCAAGVVGIGAILIRRIFNMQRRLTVYGTYLGSLVAGFVILLVFWRQILDIFGRDETLTGRDHIWETVIERALTSPIIGSGFASPWIPWDPAFAGWILDHGMSVLHAHNVWLDVWLQLGVVGVALLAVIYIAVMWRSWFFAVDRPRWDLVADRPYHPYTLVPLLIMSIILIEGLAESGPLTNWGWLFVVMFAAKLKLSPVMGIGDHELQRRDLDSEPQRSLVATR